MMIVTTVEIHVVKEHVEEFIQATLENYEDSTREPGNLRFDVLQSREDPCRFTLYEAYDSDESAAAHKQTEHYARWRDAVAPWMASPRRGVPHTVIAPVERRLWK